MKKTTILNETNFEAAIGGQVPVLVDFWAEWCGPCRMIAPVVEELAAEYEGRAVVAKVNVDEAPELAARYGISAIPTFILFKEGKALRTVRGAPSKAVLARSLAEAA